MVLPIAYCLCGRFYNIENMNNTGGNPNPGKLELKIED